MVEVVAVVVVVDEKEAEAVDVEEVVVLVAEVLVEVGVGVMAAAGGLVAVVVEVDVEALVAEARLEVVVDLPVEGVDASRAKDGDEDKQLQTLRPAIGCCLERSIACSTGIAFALHHNVAKRNIHRFPAYRN